MRPRRPRVLPFPTPAQSPPTGGGSPPRRYPGLVATLSLDAKELARLVARDLADEWVAGLIADHQRQSGTAASGEPVRCGAPRRHAPHAPCRSTHRLASGRCRWHQGPQETRVPLRGPSGADAQSQVTGRSECAGPRARARGVDSRRTLAATRRAIPAPVTCVGVIQAPVGGGRRSSAF